MFRRQLTVALSKARPFLSRVSRKFFGRRWYHILRPAWFALRNPSVARYAHSSPRITLVVATYNVAPYIDAFFESVIFQRGGLAGLEVIVVDDGATDGSGMIADQWARRYPDTIRVIHQANAGVCAARNAGLLQAKGDWIAFPDPDDILSQDYLQRMRTEIVRPHDTPLLAVAAHIVLYFEDSGEYGNHILRYRFARGIRRINSTDPGSMYLAHTSNTLMRRADIMKHNIRFKDTVRPSFEDADFILRLMLASPERTITFLPGPVYFYRKRATRDSKVDLVSTNKDWYGYHIKNAYLALVKDSVRLRGHVPIFIQEAIILSLIGKLRHLTSTRAILTLPSPDVAVHFHSALTELAGFLDADTLKTAKVPSLQSDERIVLLWYKGLCAHVPWIDVVAWRAAENGSISICLQWFTGSEDIAPLAYIGRSDDKFPIASVLKPNTSFASIRGLQECWLTFWPDNTLVVQRNGEPVRLRFEGKNLPDRFAPHPFFSKFVAWPMNPIEKTG